MKLTLALAALTLALAACGGGSDAPDVAPTDPTTPVPPPPPPGTTIAFLTANDTAGSVSVTPSQGSSFRTVLSRSYANDTGAVRNIHFAVSATQVKAVGSLSWPTDFCGVQWVVRIDGVPVFYDYVFSTATRSPTTVAFNGSASFDFTLQPGSTARVELVGFVVAHGTAAICLWQSTAMAVTVK